MKGFALFLILIVLILFSGCVQQQNQGQQVSDAQPGQDLHQADIEKACGNNLVDVGETCSSCPADVKCKPNEQCENEKCYIKALKTDLDKYSCSGICANDEFCNSKGKCEKVELKNMDYCGNFVCENDENYSGKTLKTEDMGSQCYPDCQAACSSEYCNDFVEIQCGCPEYDALAERHGCINDAEPCTDCGVQESLFPELLKIQTEIYNCLVDYFKFKPSRLIYKVFNNPNLPKCEQLDGCEGTEGGAGGADYVMFHNLDGLHLYGEPYPTKPEHLQADVHETTHYFLYQMLHGIPSWFHEVVAIQTNERLNCSDKQSYWGDAYLSFKEQGGGIEMDDGTQLNVDFYKRLKEGKTSLSEEEKKDHYITSVLFIIGLEKEYDCGFYCIRDVVLKLHEYELKECAASDKNCAIQKVLDKFFTAYLAGSQEAANDRIKMTFDEVTGKDTSELFNLLEIGKYEPLPSPCGPTSTCTK
ncbi:MAG: hypothetical protein AABW72_04780 [archaeon]